MIDRDYCVMMARYNAWQNKQLLDCLKLLDHSELIRDRKSFFGSLLGTLNHILWGDQMWMSRLDGGAQPSIGIPQSTDLHPTLASWSAERFQMDGRIAVWAKNVNNIDLMGDLSWYSGAMGQDVTRPMGMVVTHFFNHQTHHRGQVHAMLTAAGVKAPVSDLFYLPEES